jgi:hypothetical protein
MGQLLIKVEGQLRFLEKKCHNFLLIGKGPRNGLGPQMGRENQLVHSSSQKKATFGNCLFLEI